MYAALKAHSLRYLRTHFSSPQLCSIFEDMLKSEHIGCDLRTLLNWNDLMNKASWVQWVQDMLYFLSYHFETFKSKKSCKRTCKMCFQGIHIEIIRYFLKKRLFDRCVEDFIFWFCCAVFRGPFLPHGVTNVNCVLFSKVEFFNHMLIHWQMDRILLPVLFLLYTSNAYKSQRGLWGYVCSCSHSEVELRAR